MADDPVVVSKSQPEKAGNSLEDKTATTSDKAAEVTDASFDGHWGSKGHGGCEGGKFYCGLEEFNSIDDRQRTQAKGIEDFRERPMMAERGTVSLSDSSVRVQVTRPRDRRDCPLLE